ncbi:uncharacterized protein LOC131938861 [Physella acuta]|uniref:uncharacterized protein LOC131938861 n=1 Tax=Physella acuta TaxID=109671 RepID=UPI0027DD2CAF|nr:uncharacterized protein LOC131938861 [Physella acuta]
MSLLNITQLKKVAEFFGLIQKQPDWSQLPYDILLHVFRYLSNSDKYHAALTCKSWLRLLSVPSLRQSGDFVFNSKNDEKAISLEIGGLSGKSRSFSEVAQLLTQVLYDQQQLRVLDLSNSQKSVNNRGNDCFTVNEGMRLLNAASKNCANTLQKLTISRFVSLEDIYPINLRFLPQFRSAIAGFSKLSDLDLSYGYLEDDLLFSLATTTSSLKVITVRVDKPPNFESSTTPEAWEDLTAACPELRVLFFIKPITESYFQDTTLMLTPSMPLYQVKWKSGSVIAIENLEEFFQHVGQNFQETLHHLYLQTDVRLDMECIDAMFKSLQPCTNLDTLSLGLTCDMSDDEEMYTTAIRDVMTRCPVSCDVILNGQAVK